VTQHHPVRNAECFHIQCAFRLSLSFSRPFFRFDKYLANYARCVAIILSGLNSWSLSTYFSKHPPQFITIRLQLSRAECINNLPHYRRCLQHFVINKPTPQTTECDVNVNSGTVCKNAISFYWRPVYYNTATVAISTAVSTTTTDYK
jgi:hypothetical protein